MGRRILALSAGVLLLGACSSRHAAPHPSLSREWRGYALLPERRALAIAGDPERNWVMGTSGGHATRREAEEAALAECKRRRAMRRMQAACQLYAVGDEIVWSGPM